MTDIPRRKLGRTDLDVTVLGYGAMELRGKTWRVEGREFTAGQATRILNAVLDAGINWIDTSIDYGTSEELIGEHISGRRREFFLASKCGCLVDPVLFTPENRMTHIFTRKNVTDGVNQSLKRLKTDYLDLVQFHQCPPGKILQQEGAVEALLDLKRAGKIRWIGSSSTLPNITEHIAMGVFDVFQIPYSALERNHEHAISEAARAGAGIVIRGGVARGAPGEGQGSSRKWARWEEARMDQLLDGMSQTEFMLRFTISHPHMNTTIVGTLNPEHLARNVAAAKKGPLPPDVYAEAKKRLIPTAGI